MVVNSFVEQSPKTKHSLRRIVIGVAIVLVIVIALLVIEYILGRAEINKAKIKSDIFIQNLSTDNAHAAYELTSPSFQQTTSESDLAAYGGNNVKVQPYSIDYNKQLGPFRGFPKLAQFQYAVTGSKNTLNVTVTLEKSGGKWQILKVHSEFQSTNL